MWSGKSKPGQKHLMVTAVPTYAASKAVKQTVTQTRQQAIRAPQHVIIKGDDARRIYLGQQTSNKHGQPIPAQNISQGNAEVLLHIPEQPVATQGRKVLQYFLKPVEDAVGQGQNNSSHVNQGLGAQAYRTNIVSTSIPVSGAAPVFHSQPANQQGVFFFADGLPGEWSGCMEQSAQLTGTACEVRHNQGTQSDNSQTNESGYAYITQGPQTAAALVQAPTETSSVVNSQGGSTAASGSSAGRAVDVSLPQHSTDDKQQVASTLLVYEKQASSGPASSNLDSHKAVTNLVSGFSSTDTDLSPSVTETEEKPSIQELDKQASDHSLASGLSTPATNISPALENTTSKSTSYNVTANLPLKKRQKHFSPSTTITSSKGNNQNVCSTKAQTDSQKSDKNVSRGSVSVPDIGSCGDGHKVTKQQHLLKKPTKDVQQISQSKTCASLTKKADQPADKEKKSKVDKPEKSKDHAGDSTRGKTDSDKQSLRSSKSSTQTGKPEDKKLSDKSKKTDSQPVHKHKLRHESKDIKSKATHVKEPAVKNKNTERSSRHKHKEKSVETHSRDSHREGVSTRRSKERKASSLKQDTKSDSEKSGKGSRSKKKSSKHVSEDDCDLPELVKPSRTRGSAKQNLQTKAKKSGSVSNTKLMATECPTVPSCHSLEDLFDSEASSELNSYLYPDLYKDGSDDAQVTQDNNGESADEDGDTPEVEIPPEELSGEVIEGLEVRGEAVPLIVATTPLCTPDTSQGLIDSVYEEDMVRGDTLLFESADLEVVGEPIKSATGEVNPISVTCSLSGADEIIAAHSGGDNTDIMRPELVVWGNRVIKPADVNDPTKSGNIEAQRDEHHGFVQHSHTQNDSGNVNMHMEAIMTNIECESLPENIAIDDVKFRSDLGTLGHETFKLKTSLMDLIWDAKQTYEKLHRYDQHPSVVSATKYQSLVIDTISQITQSMDSSFNILEYGRKHGRSLQRFLADDAHMDSLESSLGGYVQECVIAIQGMAEIVNQFVQGGKSKLQMQSCDFNKNVPAENLYSSTTDQLEKTHYFSAMGDQSVFKCFSNSDCCIVDVQSHVQKDHTPRENPVYLLHNPQSCGDKQMTSTPIGQEEAGQGGAVVKPNTADRWSSKVSVDGSNLLYTPSGCGDDSNTRSPPTLEKQQSLTNFKDVCNEGSCKPCDHPAKENKTVSASHVSDTTAPSDKKPSAEDKLASDRSSQIQLAPVTSFGEEDATSIKKHKSTASGSSSKDRLNTSSPRSSSSFTQPQNSTSLTKKTKRLFPGVKAATEEKLKKALAACTAVGSRKLKRKHSPPFDAAFGKFSCYKMRRLRNSRLRHFTGKKSPPQAATLRRSPRISLSKKEDGEYTPSKHYLPHKKYYNRNSPDEVIPPLNKRGFPHREECFEILNAVYNNKQSEDFRNEVRSEEIPGYSAVVTFPMCLDVMGYKLRQNKYRKLSEFVSDMRRIFWNFRLFATTGQVGRQQMKNCEAVEKFFESKLTQKFPDENFNDITGSPKHYGSEGTSDSSSSIPPSPQNALFDDSGKLISIIRELFS